MMNKFFYKDEGKSSVLSLSPLQVQKGLAEGLQELTQAEVDEHLNPKHTAEQLADTVRAKRDGLIKSVRWRIERHNDELALGREPTEPLEPLLQYVQDLRDVPQQEGFPETVKWPEVQ